MADSSGLVLQVCPAPEDDAEELIELAAWLRAELLGLDVQGVDRLSDEAEAVPSGAKGVAAVAGWLSVQLGAEALRACWLRWATG
jgi:hypothetical protein